MARKTKEYRCSSCGYRSPVKLGRCPHCRAWNTLEEYVEVETAPSTVSKASQGLAAAGIEHGWLGNLLRKGVGPASERDTANDDNSTNFVDSAADTAADDIAHKTSDNIARTATAGAAPRKQSSAVSPETVLRGADILPLTAEDEGREQRFSSGNGEFDRVLGGGFVKGSLVLVGGDPGIGKSTLLLQILGSARTDLPLLYICGEESPAQVRLRADRLGINRASISLLPETEFERIAPIIARLQPSVVVVDSIQTAYSAAIDSVPGSVSQVRDVAAGFLRLAKELDITVVLVGHVTKEGSLAGPRVLEHMVDTVLYFEGDGNTSLRVIRARKNRFGATDEIGMFEMTDRGLLPVVNPSAALLEGRPLSVPGTVITSCIEGTRPVLVEIQALLSDSQFNVPQRMAQGLDRNRVVMLLAVMEKSLRAGLAQMDAFINVVGGLTLREPSTDLAVCAAIASSLRGRPLRENMIVFGEVGLTGEVRAVSRAAARVAEAVRLGFTTCVVPSQCRKAILDGKRSARATAARTAVAKTAAPQTAVAKATFAKTTADKAGSPANADPYPDADLIFVDNINEALDVCLT
ncbi:MAG: DNA repair protein RadA [Clostridiaceae bacterium]|nr:DNA repair protein RadA [Clostridiaceae bacterium]